MSINRPATPLQYMFVHTFVRPVLVNWSWTVATERAILLMVMAIRKRHHRCNIRVLNFSY